MATIVVNGVRLFCEEHGNHERPLILVHGSWGDHRNWDAVVPALSRSFRVVTYDRRGHSRSERLPAQGSIDEDVADLAALIAEKELAPAYVAGNSFGAAIALKLAAARPELFAGLIAHEPPLLGMLEGHPALPPIRERIGAVLEKLRAGQMEAGAEQFVETVAFGPGSWATLSPEIRETFAFNAPTFLDEMNEPESAMTVDLARLSRFDRPALLSQGDRSPPFFGVILEKVASALPHARRRTFHGAGHVPHLTHPDDYAAAVAEFITVSSGR